ncbi:hypothetical protein SJI19_23080 [Acerihabitans sp. TG2]|uniref:hypothetical protein n=1 Tax=Acerihabitans sp. TG2 TaxID=3096008 RepID=UPI002B2277A8|nr:hypothetical protein [Acerihabitans sp. TG2]MEA9393384.1 hypothetical protein [Acerihabitans sp. TG2]
MKELTSPLSLFSLKEGVSHIHSGSDCSSPQKTNAFIKMGACLLRIMSFLYPTVFIVDVIGVFLLLPVSILSLVSTTLFAPITSSARISPTTPIKIKNPTVIAFVFFMLFNIYFSAFLKMRFITKKYDAVSYLLINKIKHKA